MSTAVVYRTSPARTAPTAPTAPTDRAAVDRGTVDREPASEPPLRLTRRGRLVALLAVLVLLGLGSVVLGSGVVATGESSAPQVARTVTMQPGQTLWDLARQADPDADPRVVVDDIVKLNALRSGGDVQPGQQVAVPAY